MDKIEEKEHKIGYLELFEPEKNFNYLVVSSSFGINPTDKSCFLFKPQKNIKQREEASLGVRRERALFSFKFSMDSLAKIKKIQ